MTAPPDLLSWQAPYPRTPAHSKDDTSIAAAEAMRLRAGNLRAKVLEHLKQKPMTVHECARAMNETVPSTQPRFSELRAMGLIEDSGERRQNDSGRAAIVWKVCGSLTLAADLGCRSAQ